MVLKTQVATAGKVFNRSGLASQLVLVMFAIRTITGTGKIVAVHGTDVFAVDVHFDMGALAGNLDVVHWPVGLPALTVLAARS